MSSFLYSNSAKNANADAAADHLNNSCLKWSRKSSRFEKLWLDPMSIWQQEVQDDSLILSNLQILEHILLQIYVQLATQRLCVFNGCVQRVHWLGLPVSGFLPIAVFNCSTNKELLKRVRPRNLFAFSPLRATPQTLNGRTGRLGSSCVSRFPLHHHHWHRPLPAKHHHHTTVAPGSSHWHPHLSTTTALQSHPSTTTLHETIQCPNLPHLPRFPAYPWNINQLWPCLLWRVHCWILETQWFTPRHVALPLLPNTTDHFARSFAT